MDTVRVAVEVTPEDQMALRMGARQRSARSNAPADEGSYLGPMTYEFDSEGVRVSRPGASSFCSWRHIHAIERIADTLILWTDRASGMAIPLKGLPSDMPAETLERIVRALFAAVRPPAGPTATPRPPHTGFAGAIVAAGRLGSLRRASRIREVATDGAVISFGAVTLAIWVLLDGWLAGEGAQFQLWDTLTISIYAMLLLLVAFVLARASRPRPTFRSVLFVLMAGLPIVIAAAVLVTWRLQGRAASCGLALLALYGIAYAFNALRSLSGFWQPRAVAAAIVVLAMFSAYSRIAELSPRLWAPAASEESAEDGGDMAPSVAESLLFDQRALIDDAVDQMTEVEGAKPAVFFVGFAGVAEQRVFAEEIKFAGRVVDERFDTGARQLFLINDRRDLNTYPIATASGLGYALSAIAQKMDSEHDILFLALSSHGSEDPSLSVSNGSLPLEQLSDDDLEAALRESGIKFRIIVISACYGGAFIKSLQNPDTVVITAAAADKTSFGCSDDRDMTYFGEAFYRDALPSATTLQEAFERARTAIANREKQEHQTPSDPQAFFGKEIAAVLGTHPMRAERHGTLSTGILSAPQMSDLY